MSAWLLTLTGEWGPRLLAWYDANSWINLLFVAYGAVLMLAWRNYDRIQEKAIEALLAAASPAEAEDGFRLPEKAPVDWQQAVAGLSYPLLARRGYLRMQRLSAESAERTLDWRVTRIIAERKLERMQRK